MSKINALRLINLNYNNNAIRISDETFQMQGESTLLSLRNGGGKSVLVQMMLAPFVHKRYRDAKDRPFESYFTTNKPSFIMVEWALDQGAGYVLTGMMVRRNQNMDTEQNEPLEIIQFICEYTNRCQQDIYHLPLVEKNKKEIVLKNYNMCRQLFEEYKRDRSMKFFYYDMGNSAQAKQYFDKLTEYQIYYKEWETIMKKINLKESGLSDLFADCKDEKGLIEKWFLDTIESKLNKDKNRMKEFQNIIEKYIGQYKDNQSKIQRRDTIRQFQEDSVEILDRAQAYENCEEDTVKQEHGIAGLCALLQQEEQKQQGDREELEMQIHQVEQAMEHIELERISREVYEERKEETFHIANRDMAGMERDALEQECSNIEHTLHVLQGVKQRDSVSVWQKEHQILTEQLAVLEQDEKELEPERKTIGARLYRHYEQSVEKSCREETDRKAQWQEEKAKEQTAQEEAERLQKLMTELAVNIGKTQTKIQGFDEKEDGFCHRYEEKLARNILGEYEPGSLQILGKQYQEQRSNLEKSYLLHRKNLEEKQEQIRSLQRKTEDTREEIIRTELEEKKQQDTRSHYEEEMKKRQVILRYLDMRQDELWNLPQILTVAERKLTDCERVRRELEKEEDQLQKEYKKLTQGSVLELPEEFKAMLDHVGIQYVYGMDWLAKNNNTAKQNIKLVKEHPFLPYSLLMSEQEMNRLRSQKEEVYTSFPVPIIPREQLNQQTLATETPLVSMEQVSFYVWFNENLLDEESLQKLIQEKEQQIQKKKEQIAVRRQEYREYFEKREQIRNQDISKEKYDKILLLETEIKEQLRHLSMQLDEQNKELLDTQKQCEELTQTLDMEKRQGHFLQQREDDFEEFCRSYDQYMEQKQELTRYQREMKRAEEKQKLNQEQLKRVGEKLLSLRALLESLAAAVQEGRKKLRTYEAYQTVTVEETDENLQQAAQQLEARYEAITSKMSYERQDLEKRLTATGNHLSAAQEELQDLMAKYQLTDAELEQVTYQKKEEQHQEELLQEQRKKLRRKEKLWNEEDKRAAVIQHQIGETIKRIKKRFQREEPLPEEEIITADFDEALNQHRYQKEQLSRKLDSVKDKLISIGENLTSLADYSDFTYVEEAVPVIDIAVMSARELRDYKGKMLRDYRACMEESRRKKEKLEQYLNVIVRKELYQEEFYKKPIENLLALTDKASQVISQLQTILMSYQTLMEKLAVDISVIEKERDKIMELLMDYIQEVHKNLGQIDHNSTITIRDKPVKMLKLVIPEWEENESVYQLRLQDFMKELTDKGIEVLNQNLNPQELIGTRVTTKNLYDTIVGIGNIQIKLYKIEEQREYPITWAEVARNSGGEGFLSAFIILSSLLYYMRKDESDIFAEKNEGKVLVMDNPFAQTNAAHLLKPLMDMAKKTNTQLICLSGLGGDSIYGRFDNIYVLNLVNASMRNGLQYLKADHARGTETETMIVSQIEVVEQQSLLF